MESFHIIDERIDQEVSIFLDIHELEVEAPALVWQGGQVFAEQSTLTPMKLSISVFFNKQDGLFPLLAIKKPALSIFNRLLLRVLILLCFLGEVRLSNFPHSEQRLYLDHAATEPAIAEASDKHRQNPLKYRYRSELS